MRRKIRKPFVVVKMAWPWPNKHIVPIHQRWYLVHEIKQRKVTRFLRSAAKDNTWSRFSTLPPSSWRSGEDLSLMWGERTVLYHQRDTIRSLRYVTVTMEAPTQWRRHGSHVGQGCETDSCRAAHCKPSVLQLTTVLGYPTFVLSFWQPIFKRAFMLGQRNDK